MDEQTVERGLAGLDLQIKSFIGKHESQQNEFANRILALEQRGASTPGGMVGETKSLGDLIAQSEGVKAMIERGVKNSGAIKVGSFHKTAIVNATGGSQPLVHSQRYPGIVPLATPRLTVRDLLPQYRASSNLVDFMTPIRRRGRVVEAS